jgi:hypothetical protein
MLLMLLLMLMLMLMLMVVKRTFWSEQHEPWNR